MRVRFTLQGCFKKKLHIVAAIGLLSSPLCMAADAVDPATEAAVPPVATESAVSTAPAESAAPTAPAATIEPAAPIAPVTTTAADVPGSAAVEENHVNDGANKPVLADAPNDASAVIPIASPVVKPKKLVHTNKAKQHVVVPVQAVTAKSAHKLAPLQSIAQIKNPVVARVKQEDEVTSNPFAVVFFKPTYILPFYYTGSPYNSAYRTHTPQNESLKHDEVKYQLSFKVPLWNRILNYPSSLYFGYTQMSYWQLYDHDPFFRSTDYEPEVFLSNELNIHLGSSWQLNSFNIGAVHQSNGAGGNLERSWNRAYLAAVASTDHWMVAVKPWIILHDNTYLRQNSDMAKFLGYGQITIAYKYYNQVLTLETRNMIESGGRRSGTTVSWSFPMTKYLKGYVQVFSGYGQSLIEYNHRTNSVGMGIALSNWV